jgi:hypothetical protein
LFARAMQETAHGIGGFLGRALDSGVPPL